VPYSGLHSLYLLHGSAIFWAALSTPPVSVMNRPTAFLGGPETGLHSTSPVSAINRASTPFESAIPLCYTLYSSSECHKQGFCSLGVPYSLRYCAILSIPPVSAIHRPTSPFGSAIYSTALHSLFILGVSKTELHSRYSFGECRFIGHTPVTNVSHLQNLREQLVIFLYSTPRMHYTSKPPTTPPPPLPVCVCGGGG
jgi:hypothetical protein